MTHFDKIAQPAIQKIYSLVVQIPSFQGNTSDAAAFVVKEGDFYFYILQNVTEYDERIMLSET